MTDQEAKIRDLDIAMWECIEEMESLEKELYDAEHQPSADGQP